MTTPSPTDEPPPSPAEPLLPIESRGMVSIARAAAYLDVKPKTIRHLIDTGRIKATILGRELRISVASLRRLAGAD